MRSVCSLFVLTSACTAQLPVERGPTFGGDQRAARAVAQLAQGRLPTAPLTEAGLLATWPVAIPRVPCGDGLCLDARAAWLPDDELLVAVGIDVVADRAPSTVAFALDASGSMTGHEDVRAATVEIALDHLDVDDRLGLWGFTGVAVELVAPAPVDEAHRHDVRMALDALDRLPTVRQVVARHEDGCAHSFDALFEASETGLDTGSPGSDEAEELRQIVASAAHEDLGDRLVRLVCDDGSAIDDAVEDVLASLPDGTVDHSRRLVLVSDLGGPSARDAVEAAATRFVGTTVLGVTPASDGAAAADLAGAPGALMLDAASPAHALATWDQRFDALLTPLAWDVDLSLSDRSRGHWVLERRVGTTDDDATGANALFASTAHGVLGAVLRPVGDPDTVPVLDVTLRTPEGDVVAAVASLVPHRWIRTDWGEGDDEVALAVAWRLAVVDAVKAGDQDRLQTLLSNRRPEIGPGTARAPAE